MDGISRTAGVGPLITLGGEKFTVQGRILRHYAEIEAEIIKLRGNPLQMVRDSVAAMSGGGDVDSLLQRPEFLTNVVSMMFDEAKRWRFVDRQDLAQFLSNTWHGIVVSTWLAIRHNDIQRLTITEVGNLLSDEYESRMRKDPEDAQQFAESIFSAIDQAGGEDELGNSTGSLTGAESNEVELEQKPETMTD